MLDDIKKELQADTTNHDDDSDNDILDEDEKHDPSLLQQRARNSHLQHKQNKTTDEHKNDTKNESESEPAASLQNKRRGSQPINAEMKDEEEATDGHEFKHTDSLSAIKVGRKWYMNQYLCYKFLGKGSFGKVCLAKDITTNKKYAIKVLNKSVLRRKRILQRKKPPSNMLENIFREIAIMKKLSHPNVMKIYEVIDDPENDKLCMVIDYMDNGSVLGEKGAEATCDPMTDHELIRRYIRDMILGLDYLHANDIIHGDIKPENLLLSKDHHLKIADFGVSFMLDDETCPNKDGKISRAQGTPAFTAPEAGGKAFDAYPVDVWAMGVTLYMMITGICPFAGNGIYDTYEKIQSEDPPIPDNIDKDMRDFLVRILQKDPNKRITLKQAMVHPWITKHGTEPLQHPTKYNEEIFEKRVSVTKQDIEYAVSLPNKTVKHLRRASLEFDHEHQIYNPQNNDIAADSGTKHRGSIEENPSSADKQTNMKSQSSESETSVSEQHNTPQSVATANGTKPSKKMPAKQTASSKATRKSVNASKTKKNANQKQKDASLQYVPFSVDANGQTKIVEDPQRAQTVTYTSKPGQITAANKKSTKKSRDSVSKSKIIERCTDCA